MIRYLFFASISCYLFASCNTVASHEQKPDTAGINKDSLSASIAVLSSDSFMGRKPFTEGETKAINFLQQQFAALGLQPGNGSSYLQEVPMVNIASDPAATMRVQSASGIFDLKGFDDYVIWSEKTDPKISIDNSEVVFAGYGVVAPEYNRNDYAGLDVKGKTVLILVNDPGFHNKNLT